MEQAITMNDESNEDDDFIFDCIDSNNTSYNNDDNDIISNNDDDKMWIKRFVWKNSECITSCRERYDCISLNFLAKYRVYNFFSVPAKSRHRKLILAF